MKLYRFSPIKTKDDLFEAIEHIHFEGYKLCWNSFNKYLPNAGNMGVFCHYDEEYEFLLNIRKELTESCDNVNQKYFRLLEPITFTKKEEVPETTYEYLYIRKPDPYRHHVGDLDLYLEQEQYNELKQNMLNGKEIRGARVFDRPDLDMIELYNPDSDVLTYISTEKMTNIVRTKQSDITKL